MKLSFSSIFKICIVLACIAFAVLVYAKGWDHYLSYGSLQAHHQQLMDFLHDHYLLFCLGFIGIYVLMGTISMPFIVYFTVLGGLMFGTWLGFAFNWLADVLCGIFSYWLNRYIYSQIKLKDSSPKMQAIKAGLHKYAFWYSVALRLSCMVPFVFQNLVSGAFRLNFKAYIAALCIGVIPSTLIYTSVGSGLTYAMQNHMSLEEAVFQPRLYIPILCVAAFIIIAFSIKKLFFKKL